MKPVGQILYGAAICLLISDAYAANAVQPGETILLLDLYCNSQSSSHIAYVLRDENNQLWLKEESFSVCRLPIKREKKKIYQDEIYYPLVDVPYLYDSL